MGNLKMAYNLVLFVRRLLKELVSFFFFFFPGELLSELRTTDVMDLEFDDTFWTKAPSF